MPTYEFRCKKGHITEEFHTMSGCPNSIDCSKCGKKADKMISGGAAILWKGSLPPGEKLKRKRENSKIMRRANKARKLKETGKVPMEEVIRLKDRKLDD